MRFSFFSSSRHFSLYGPLASVLIILNTPATAALIYNHIMKKGESIMQPRVKTLHKIAIAFNMTLAEFLDFPALNDFGFDEDDDD